MKLRKSKRIVSILVTLSFLVAMLVPITALAYTENRVSTVPTIASDATNTSLGSLTIKEDSDYPEDLLPDRTFTVTFPSGVKLVSDTEVTWSNNGGPYSVLDETYVKQTGDYTLDITLPAVDENVDAIKISPVVDIDGFDGGDIEVIVDGFDSGVTSGKYVLGRVGIGDTTAVAMEVKTIGESGKGGDIRITENCVNAIGEDVQEITLKLPTNFKWDTEKMNSSRISFMAGLSGTELVVDAYEDNAYDDGKIFMDGRTLKFKFDPVKNRVQRGIIQIEPWIVAESNAAYGEVEVDLSGDEIDDADLVIANYSDFDIAITADGDLKEVLAGQIDAELTKLYFKEKVAGSFISGRKTKIEFPSWVKVMDVDVSGVKGVDAQDLKDAIKADIDENSSDVEFVVPDATSPTSKIEFKLKFTVSIKANASGDIVAKVSGRSTASGEAVIGKCLAPVTAVAENIKDVRIGVKDQPIGDIIITESKKEAIMDDASYDELIVSLPDNIEWSDTPKVEVIEGNLDIDEDAVDTEDNELIIPIKSSSTKPSKIKISGGKVDIDRTVPEGAVMASIKGSALVENDKSQVDLKQGGFDQFTVVKVEVARVTTPAPVDTKNVAVFTIGDTEYVLNGAEMTMDVAPYIKNDRTYMPLRFVANAAGVPDANIMWNAADQSVVLIKGDRVVKLVIGSNTMLINGVEFTMDVAPELVDPGRTMLPVRWVAQALGCTVEWDEVTQTVTVQQ